MRILGLDYGESRIGVALSDESGTMAQGIATLVRKNRQKDLQAISALLEVHRPEKIVIGYPRRMDGTEGIQCEKARRFADLIGRAFAVPVVLWDETCSTKEAEEIMIRTNVKREKRRSIVDRIAAAVILQNYLDALRDAEGKQTNS